MQIVTEIIKFIYRTICLIDNAIEWINVHLKKFNNIIGVVVKCFITDARTLHNHYFKRETDVVYSLVAIISLEFTHEKAVARRIPVASTWGCKNFSGDEHERLRWNKTVFSLLWSFLYKYSHISIFFPFFFFRFHLQQLCDKLLLVLRLILR